MDNLIMALTLENRSEIAPSVQQVLTDHGREIHVRLGLRDEGSIERGIILLHVCAEPEQVESLKKDLAKIEGVKVKTMVLD